MGPLGVAPSEPGFAPEVAGAAVVALHNLAVHRLLPLPADAVVNVVTAAGLTAFARHAGCSHDDLGTRSADAATGLRLGLAAAAVATGGVVLGASLPATRPFFRDRRVIDVGRREAIYHWPFGSRSPPPLPRNSPSAAPCSAWPGGDARPPPPSDGPRCSSATRTPSRPCSTTTAIRRGLVADPRKGRWVAVLGTTLSTAVAGCLFAWLPLRSRSLLAPILATPPAMPRPTRQANGWSAMPAKVEQKGQQNVSDSRALLPVGRGFRHH
jgi:hypothetical protein